MNNVYTKMNDLRSDIHSLPLKKSGRNRHGGYDYFELKDFMPDAVNLMKKHKVFAFIEELTAEYVTIRVIDTENPESYFVTKHVAMVARLPRGKKNKEESNQVDLPNIQDIGATSTYMRRYAWMMLFELVVADDVDREAINQANEQERIVGSFVERFHVISLTDATPEAINHLKKDIKSQKIVSASYLWDQMKSVFRANGWSVDDKTGDIFKASHQQKQTPVIEQDNPFKDAPLPVTVKEAEVTSNLMELNDDPFGGA